MKFSDSSPKFIAALIDLDGTLLNTKKAIDASLEHAFSFIGLDSQDSLVQELAFEVMSVGASLGQAAQKFWSRLNLSADIDPEAIVAEYRNYYTRVARKLTEPFPGVTAALQRVTEKDIPLYVVTNKGEDAAKEALNDAQLLSYFSQLITDRPGIIPKPNPQSYLEIIAPSLGNPPPQKVLMIGDTTTDILYAQAAGIQACWVRYGYGDPIRVAESSPDFIANTPADWAALILGTEN